MLANPRLARYQLEEKPRGSHLFQTTRTSSLYGLPSCLGTRRAVVIGPNTRSVAAAHGESRRDRILPRLVTRFYRWTYRVVGLAGVVEDLAGRGCHKAGKMRVIHNPIVRFDLGASAPAPLAHPWFDNGEPVFVAVGLRRPQKDFPTLLRPFAARRARPLARLVILGNGGEWQDLETLAVELAIHEDVQLPGVTPNSYAYMARTAAFVRSSRREGLPPVLVETLRWGAPVVAADGPSESREILGGGRYRSVVSMVDVNALADSLKAVLVRPARDETWRLYEQERVVDAYPDVLVGASAHDALVSEPFRAAA